jgi:hypothetical protein
MSGPRWWSSCSACANADVSGDILRREANYCHMMIPMYFDPLRYPASEDGTATEDPETGEPFEGNEIGWIDPRALTPRLAQGTVSGVRVSSQPRLCSRKSNMLPKYNTQVIWHVASLLMRFSPGRRGVALKS